MRWYWSAAGVLVASTSLPLVALSWFAWRRRNLSAASSLALVVAAAGWWALAHSLALASPHPGAAAAWSDAALLGALLTPPSWLVFALRYTGRSHRSTPLVTAALAIVPAVTVVLLAGGWTHDLVASAPLPGQGAVAPLVAVRSASPWPSTPRCWRVRAAPCWSAPTCASAGSTRARAHC